MRRVILSQKKYEELLEELEYLKKVRRREISKEIAVAREKGDIMENAEYDAAKEAQGQLEKRIAELEDKLSCVALRESLDIDTSKAYIGALVKLKNIDTQEETTYQLVSQEEADFSTNKISIESPIGKALLGHKKNDKVKINVPAGVLEFKILDMSY